MGRAPCCDKANVKKGPWSPEEDLKLKEYIEKYGTGGNWIALPQKAGLRRCGKSCRLRWLNYLRPNIKHGEFSDEEDRIICTLFANIGSRWSIIAAQLPGRTDNDIKNYWNTKLKKKLMGFVNPPYNYVHNNNNISQRKLPVVPFPNHYYNSHETTTSSSSSSSFSLCQPLFSNYSSSYQNTSTTTPTSSTRLSEHHLSNMISSNPNCCSTFPTNLSSSFNFQTQEYYSLVGYNYPNLKDQNSNLLMFGSEGSCSTSSEGSCSYQIKQEEIGSGFQNQQGFSMGNGRSALDQDQISERFMLNYGGYNNGEDCNYQNPWGQKPNGCFGEGPILDQYHVLEDLKQLISSSSRSTGNSQGNEIINGSNNLFNIDEYKTQGKVMYF